MAQQDDCEMNDIISKNQANKRSRAKSTFGSDIFFTKNESLVEVINLDDLPEKSEKSNVRMSKAAPPQSYLFNKFQEDIVKGLIEPKSYSTAIHNKIKISNGQLSDINGPIRLLDKSTKKITTPSVMARIQSQNDAIASLPTKDKARKLKESIESNETVLNMLESGDEKPIKRTYSRSKSVSVKSPMHFRIDVKSKSKVKKPIHLNPTTPIIEHDWQTLEDSLSSTMAVKSIMSSGDSGGSEQVIYGNHSRAQSPSEIEQVLTWNTSKTLGQLPSSQFIFQRNEFDMTEMDMLAMTKLKAIKQHKNDYKNFPHLEPSMACGHSDSAACFDAIIQRLNAINSNNDCKVNEKKPHQYYSTEFKQVIGALVQNKNSNCQAITADDVKNALRETNMYVRTKNSNHFSWSRFIDYYNATENSVTFAPAELFVNVIPRTPNTFEIGQKLEAIDPQNSDLFCVCTIVDKCGYRIKLRFDGSSTIFDFWVIMHVYISNKKISPILLFFKITCFF